MAKHSRPVADFGDGIKKVWHDLHDGGWAYETVQDCTPILDANKEVQNHGVAQRGDWRMSHRIPLILFLKWRQDYGIDYWDPNHAKAVERLLDSSDWQYLRVDGNKNHNVSYSGVKVGADTPIFQAPKWKAGTVFGSDGTPMQAAH